VGLELTADNRGASDLHPAAAQRTRSSQLCRVAASPAGGVARRTTIVRFLNECSLDNGNCDLNRHHPTFSAALAS
jgi:hypothetical protein